MEHAKISGLPIAATSSYNPEKHTIDWVNNDGEWDRHGEAVAPDGGSLAAHVNFVDHHLMQANVTIQNILGVVMPNSYRMQRMSGYGNKKVGVSTVYFDQNNPIGVLAEGMARDGTLRNGSIRFDPKAWILPGEKKITRRAKGVIPPMGGPGTIWAEWKMLEFSAVGVPSNEGALARMCKAYGIDPERAGIDDRDRAEQLVLRYRDPEEIDFLEEVAAELKGAFPELRGTELTLEEMFQ